MYETINDYMENPNRKKREVSGLVSATKDSNSAINIDEHGLVGTEQLASQLQALSSRIMTDSQDHTLENWITLMHF